MPERFNTPTSLDYEKPARSDRTGSGMPASARPVLLFRHNKKFQIFLS
jgi:hypothetical protein